MWITRREELTDNRGIKIAIDRDSSPLSYNKVLQCWQHDANFRSWFDRLLADSPFHAFRWETPPITANTADRSFEFVLLDSPSLANRSPDANTFAAYFAGVDRSEVVEFPNLGKDAILVVPCPREPLCAYTHLAAFVRSATESQRHTFWQLVGRVMERRLGSQPVWLNTAGGGVSWLHVRLDDRPKYYGYAAYRFYNTASG